MRNKKSVLKIISHRHGSFRVVANGKAKNMPENATPVATNLVGIAQETGGGDTADSWILVNKGSYVI